MGMTQAQVLWDSVFHRYKSTLVYDGTVVSGFDPLNAVDWFDFSIFRASAGSSRLDVNVAVDTPIDSAVIWLSDADSAPTAVLIQYEATPSVFTTIGTYSGPTEPGIAWLDLTAVTVPAGRRVRALITHASGVTDFRQISVGQKLTFPIGQWADINHPTLTQGIITETVIAVNGSILGRNVRRSEKQMEINLTYLDPAFVRGEWELFAQHAAKKAFWYRWNPTEYPADVAFSVATEIVPPKNMRPAPKMMATMPLKVITS